MGPKGLARTRSHGAKANVQCVENRCRAWEGYLGTMLEKNVAEGIFSRTKCGGQATQYIWCTCVNRP